MLKNILNFSGKCEESIEKCKATLALAERIGDPDMIADANGSASAPLYLSGRLAEALQSAQRSMGADRIKTEWTKFAYIVSADQAAAFALLLLGHPDQAEKGQSSRGGEGQPERPRNSSAGKRRVECPHILSSFLYIATQRPDRVRDLARRALEAAEQAGLAFESARWRVLLGWAIARLGNPDEGIAMIRSGIADASATGANAIILVAVALSDALVTGARYGEALVTVLSNPDYHLLSY